MNSCLYLACRHVDPKEEKGKKGKRELMEPSSDCSCTVSSMRTTGIMLLTPDTT
jgi:hypothetical protein